MKPFHHHASIVSLSGLLLLTSACPSEAPAPLALRDGGAPAACEGASCDAGLPDLRINAESASASLRIWHRTFADDACELGEMCVSGSGRRRLLEFEGRIDNLGPGDLDLGSAEGNPLFEFSACHGHQHLRDFTDYRLVRADGGVAALGHKQSFCLSDMVQVDMVGPAPNGTRPPAGDESCGLLSAGWSDIYGIGTPCQWVDITDVPPGEYLLELAVNPEGRFAETDLSNNRVHIPVSITEDLPCVPQFEVCGDALDQDCDDLSDDVDPDCPKCEPGAPFCEETRPVTGNDRCAQAYAMPGPATYGAWIAEDDPGERALSCGGAGGDVFFAFELDREQAVYLGSMGSSFDTVLALYQGGCEGEELHCVDDACGGTNGHFVDVLPAGRYVVAVRAKDATSAGAVRLQLQQADPHGAVVLDGPGIYAGDTRESDDSAMACAEPSLDAAAGSSAGSSGMNAGPLPDETCVASVGQKSAGQLSHECLHCACAVDGGSMLACDEACWSAIRCITDSCAGDPDDTPCIQAACSAMAIETDAVESASSALRGCAGTCPLAPDVEETPSQARSAAPDDVYVLAACERGLSVSTCGTSEFDAVIDVRPGALSSPSESCSEQLDLCDGDALGTAVIGYPPLGLTFVVVDGIDQAAAGAYQLAVTY